MAVAKSPATDAAIIAPLIVIFVLLVVEVKWFLSITPLPTVGFAPFDVMDDFLGARVREA
jgi:hypothetical protein